MKVRIKPGSRVGQDFCFGMRWPQCLAPGGGHVADDPSMVFTTDSNMGPFGAGLGKLALIAVGYGDRTTKDGYGNGAIFVDCQDVEYLDEPSVLPFLGANL